MRESTRQKDISISLKISPDEKAMFERAAALDQLDIAEFVVQAAVKAARKTLEPSEPVVLPDLDSRRVLDLLDDPSEDEQEKRRAGLVELAALTQEIGLEY